MPRRVSVGPRRAVWLFFLAMAVALFASSPAAGASGVGEVELADRETKQANELFQKGQLEQAVVHYQTAAASYRDAKRGDLQADALVQLGAAYQALGRYGLADRTLMDALKLAEAAHDARRTIAAKNALGSVLTFTRDIKAARKNLNEALTLATALGDQRQLALVQLNLGNLHATTQADPQAYPDAIASFLASRDASTRAGDQLLVAQASVNAAMVALDADNNSDSVELNEVARQTLLRVPDSSAKARLLITVGRTNQRLAARLKNSRPTLIRHAYDCYTQAGSTADSLGDARIASYACGYLGQLYEEEGRGAEALPLARKAVFLAQRAQSPVALYRWQWLTARLLRSQPDQRAEAIQAYRRAVETLSSVRGDVAMGLANASYHDAVGPLYYELADLLFKQADVAQSPEESRQALLDARDTVELLKAAELDDYFQETCVNVERSREKSIASVGERTGVVYLVPLADRTEILLDLGRAGGLRRVTVPVGAAQLAKEVQEFRRQLETRTTRRYMYGARRLYDWVIRPLDEQLDAAQIHTLVFVPDGPLLTIPFAALHDGKEFLVARRGVAVTPGLKLVDPRALSRGRVQVLSAGLSEPRKNFPGLDFVPAELDALQQLYGGRELLNKSFNYDQLRTRISDQPYSIVHLASHAQFQKDLRGTFIVTHAGNLYPEDLRGLLLPFKFREQPIELLTLSACDTASGDDYQAALGLAGIGVHCGARSALATLWSVNDHATVDLMTSFYETLKQSSLSGSPPTKAEALRAAQLKLLADPRYHHPCYWAPYLVIGNWL